MTIPRIIAIVLVYLLACAGWMVLGTTTWLRSDLSSERLGQDVQSLWGGELVQDPPAVLAGDGSGRQLGLASSRIAVALDLEHRQKGLVWYPTYTCSFEGRYRIANPSDTPRELELRFALPDKTASYHDVVLSLDGRPLALDADPRQGVVQALRLDAGASAEFNVAYRTRGMRSWQYRPGAHLGRVSELDLALRTDFAGYDFPEGAIAADSAVADEHGVLLRWATPEMITSRSVGVLAPEKLNPGPLSARMTFFAPVCLGFFFLILAAVTIVRGVAIHPMHYLFVAGGFFAFHLLFAYLVDHLPVHPAFGIATVVSVVLVTSYLRGALGPSLPTLWIAAGQVVFLVLFSYSFFLEGSTGLVAAIGSVIFLAFLMRITARVDWHRFFGGAQQPGEASAEA